MTKDIFLFAVGIVVGGVNAIAGGGMLIGFPALLANGLSALSANATGNVLVLPGQLASAFGYRKYVRQLPRRYLLLLIPCTIGALGGAYILRRTPGSQFEALVPWLIALAVGLFALQPLLHKRLGQRPKSQRKPLRTLPLISLALLPLAVYGGYFGAGFGFVVLALLSFTPLHDMQRMNALKNLAASCIGLASIVVLAPGSFINWHAGLVMAAGSTIGGYVSARLAQRVPERFIRWLVITIGVATTAYFVAIH